MNTRPVVCSPGHGGILWQRSQSGSVHLQGQEQTWSGLQEREGLAGSLGCWTSFGRDLWQCLGGEGVSPLAEQGKRPRTTRRKM